MIRRHAVALAASMDESVERPAPGRAPSAFRIWRAGASVADDGVVHFTEESARKLLAEQAARGRPYAIDFDHLSLSSERPATAGRAAGYFALEVRRDASGAPELWATNLEWCDDVRAGLEQSPPHWRYFSPAFFADKETQAVSSFINLALCINPLTHGAPLLAAQTPRATRARRSDNRMTSDEMLAILDAQIEATDDADTKAALTAAREALAAKKSDEEPAEEEPAAEAAPPSKDDDDDKKKKDDDEEKKESAPVTTHAQGGEDAITSLTRKVVDLERRVEVGQINDLLAKHSGLPEEFKAHCRAQTLTAATAMIGAVAKVHAARPASPTQGANRDGDAMDPRDAAFIDRAMGIGAQTPVLPHTGTDGRFYLHNVRPSDLARLGAPKAKV